MSNFGASAGWGLAVAASLVVGALAAAGLQLPPRVAATLTAFGGGILLAAVAVELVPEADEQAGRWVTAGGLLAGTLLYIGADAWLTRNERLRQLRHSTHAAMVGQPMSGTPAVGEAARGEAIAAGIFVDGVPESIALGLTVAAGQIGVALLAGVLVGNVVEATVPPSQSSPPAAPGALRWACWPGSAWPWRARPCSVGPCWPTPAQP
jgi:ZIP family zinc transporter